MKTVKDLLAAKDSTIWSVSLETRVFDALKLMSEKQIGALMVIDDNENVRGIMTERDYARKIILLGKRSMETLVKEIMTPCDRMCCVNPGHTVEECMVIMTERHVRHLPVFEEGKFTGIISIGDVVKSIIADREDLIEQLKDYICGKYGS
jgi:CBS domain-containing protein